MKKILPNTRRQLSAAFTLIETLVVVSIIVLILALSGPTLLQTMQASKLSSAGDSLVGFFSEAQQTAMSMNLPIEVRFFKYETSLSQIAYYRAYQLFKVTTPPTADGAVKEVMVPMGSATRLPEGIIVLTHDELSPALSGEGQADVNPDGGTYSGVPEDKEPKYNALRFMTDGSCRKVGASQAGLTTLTYQPLTSSFVTLIGDQGASEEISPDTLPKNFYTVQIDPYTGKTRTYRPGAN